MLQGRRFPLGPHNQGDTGHGRDGGRGEAGAWRRVRESLPGWMHSYPGVAKLLQQEEDVLEGLSQEEEMPAMAPLPLWGLRQLQGEQGCVVTPPQRCGCQRPVVRWEYDELPGRLRLFHEACTCAWQMIVIRTFLRLPPLQRGTWVRRASGLYQQVTLLRSGGACRASEHASSLQRFLHRTGARLVEHASWAASL
jgi:hypothetical protein